jgi:DNA mismatch repair protein MutS
MRKVKSARGLTGSLFAALPDPILDELREIDPDTLAPEAALTLVRRLKELAPR